MEHETKVTRGSGNVFADVGLPDSGDHAVKAQVVLAIIAVINRAGLTQTEVAKRIGIAQPDVSKMVRGNFSGFSLEHLRGFLRRLS